MVISPPSPPLRSSPSTCFLRRQQLDYELKIRIRYANLFPREPEIWFEPGYISTAVILFLRGVVRGFSFFFSPVVVDVTKEKVTLLMKIKSLASC